MGAAGCRVQRTEGGAGLRDRPLRRMRASGVGVRSSAGSVWTGQGCRRDT